MLGTHVVSVCYSSSFTLCVTIVDQPSALLAAERWGRLKELQPVGLCVVLRLRWLREVRWVECLLSLLREVLG